MTMNEFPSRIKDRGVDPWKLGRWSYIVFKGKQELRDFLMVTGYRVGKRSGTPGASTAWSQQRVLLFKDKRDEDPHLAFLSDLETWLGQEKFVGMEILLMLDANEQWMEGSGITSLASARNLANINEIYNIKPTHPNILHPSRSTTIDYCLCSEGVLNAITYVSSAPYDLETLGDHRGIIIDLDIGTLLGKVKISTHLSHRKLKMNDPYALDKYLTRVQECFEKQNIVKRAERLYKRVRNGHTDMAQIMKSYNQLDKEVFGICNKSEHKCRPTIAGRYEWSPNLAQGIKQLSYWRKRLKSSANDLVVQKLGLELQIPYIPLPKEVILQKIQESQQALSEVQTNARKYRQQHLSDLAEKYSRQHNLSQSTAITELLSHEESRQIFGEIKSKLKPFHRSQLKQLWISIDENGNYSKDSSTKEIISDPEKIHKALLSRNANHLTQASTTPFARGDLKKKLKWDGTGTLADEILSGNILQQKQYSRAMQLYLESLQSNTLSQMHIVKPVLSFEEYKSFWKKKRENTVTSPYGLHVGHYKAATMCPAVLEVHRMLLLIPFQIGIVPVRWRRTVQTMLEKEPGAPWIHRLRIIELFDAQANAGFQIFVGRKLIQQAVKHNRLQTESYGSTPGKTAVAAVTQKILSLDQLRLERRAGGIFDCDASGCYDRILPPLASVHLQALGMDRSISTFLARFMYHAKRHVRTSEGISKQSIRTTKRKVLHGIGQGNGGGPAIWLSHLTVMLAAIATVCSRFFTSCVEKAHKISTVGTGYVDDVTLGISLPAEDPQSESTVRRYIRKIGQIWEQLLYISGGRLELSKCFWVPVTWKWTKGKPKMQSTSKTRAKDLYLFESESRSEVLIPKLSGKTAVKRLGVWTNCEATWSTEYKNWMEFSKNFGKKIKYAKLGRIAGYHAYHAMWMAKFRYSAPVIGFTIKQIQQIKQKIVGPCLSAAGVCSKMPRAVVFGPSKYGGLGWDNPITITIFEKLKILIGSIRLWDTVGQLYYIQLTWIQLYAGISTPVLEYETCLEFIPPGWIMHLHSLLLETNIKVEVFGLWRPTPQRQDDRVIMDFVTHHIPSRMWGGINRCRLFLQANTFADICTIDGRIVPKKIIRVIKALRLNKLSFPHQQRPSEEDRECWKYLVDSISDDGNLHLPLGAWIRPPDQKFDFMADITNNRVYKRQKSFWTVYQKQNLHSRRYKRLHIRVNTVPALSIPATVIELTQYLLIQNSFHINQSIDTGFIPEYEANTYRCRERVIGEYQINRTQNEKLQSYWKTIDFTIICATDGGLKDQIGTNSYAFFFPNDEDPILTGFSVEHQPCLAASSTRQELLGQLAAEYWLQIWKETWNSPLGRINFVLVTDSQSSIDIMKATNKIIGSSDTLRSEMDVALELQRTQVENLWVERKVVKVMSHIEREQAPDEFLWECNRIADILATEARDHFSPETSNSQKPILLPGARIGCQINGRIENNDLYSALKNSVDGYALLDYLANKYSWSYSTARDIAWTAHLQEMNKYPKPTRATLVKYLHGWLATKKRRFRSRSFIDPGCPLCGNVETNSHLFTCTNETFSQLRKSRWNELMKKFREITNDGIQQVFSEGVKSAFTEERIPNSTIVTWPSDLQQAYRSQCLIGWSHVFYGRLSTKWEIIANTAHEGMHFMWTGKIVRLFWEYGLDIWAIRNTLVHGTTGEFSQLERDKIDKMITALYQQVLPHAHSWTHDMFNLSERARASTSYHSKCAWIHSFRLLIPEKIKELERTVIGDLQSEITPD